MSKTLRIVGATPENNLVVSGCWKSADTFGIPLDMIFETLKQGNAYPDWQEILQGAKKQGVNKNKFLTQMESDVVSVYGTKVWSAIQPYLLKGFA